MSKKKKIVLSIIIIILLLLIVDMISIKTIGNPIFAYHKTLNDGGTKVYYGLGYKVIKYNQKIGRRDTQLGLYNLKYNTEPLTYDAVSIAIDYKNTSKNTKKILQNSFVRITGEVLEKDINKNILTIGYIDKGKKYSIKIKCELVKDNNHIETFNINDTVSVIGVVKKQITSNNTPVITVINAFAEKETFDK